MDNGTRQPLRLPEAVLKIHDLLEPFDQAARLRAVRSVLAMFEDAGGAPSTGGATDFAREVGLPAPTAGGPATRFSVGKRAKEFLRRFAIPDEVLERVYDMEGSRQLIA